MDPAPILGIDLGTTNVAAAFFDDRGKLRKVAIRDRRFALPAVIWPRSATELVVGQAARAQLPEAPELVLTEPRRLLGRRFDAPEVVRHLDRFETALAAAPDGRVALRAHGRLFSIDELVVRLLSQLRDHANQEAGRPLTACVLTVPSHAGYAQREALRSAAVAAGLQVRGLVKSPTAVALARVSLEGTPRTVLSLEVGGATTDATVLAVDVRSARLLGTAGVEHLGGDDFDDAIVAALEARHAKARGAPPDDSPIVRQRLRLAAEAAKSALCEREEVRVHVPCVSGDERRGFLDLTETLRRAEVEALVAPIVERVRKAVDAAMDAARKRPDELDALLWAGGMARWPSLRARLQDFRRVAPEGEVPPELAAAVGAAVVGRQLLAGARQVPDLVSRPISVLLPGGRARVVVPANTPLPCARRVALTDLPRGNQPLPLPLFEASGPGAELREPIGEVSLPAAVRAAQLRGSLELELTIAADGEVQARLHTPSGERLALPILRPA